MKFKLQHQKSVRQDAPARFSFMYQLLLSEEDRNALRSYGFLYDLELPIDPEKVPESLTKTKGWPLTISTLSRGFIFDVYNAPLRPYLAFEAELQRALDDVLKEFEVMSAFKDEEREIDVPKKPREARNIQG